ncbi:MAG: mannose-1-phosphate guanylyltransferase/mannose-6-phosphate isomerase [Thiotrichales bacterium]
MIPVILCGGSGTRLWPLSRDSYPKQFLKLIGDHSLFQNTVERVAPLTESAPIIITNEDHRFLAAGQLLEIQQKSEILLEPEGRNTAPAIAAAAFKAQQMEGEDALMLVLPADHLIEDTDAFAGAVEQGLEAARTGKLVTFGIVPDKAETGYGYIRADKNQQLGQSHPVAEFVEKPDLATAEAYVNSGDYFWNSGMFLFRADRYLEELKKFAPGIHECARIAVEKGESDLDFLRLDAEAFKASPDDSIDYVVMEKTDDAYVVPMSAGWSDVGSWSSLWEVSDEKDNGNVAHGDVISINSSDNFVHSDGRLVAAVGVNNLVIVETPDAILVADKNASQDIKKVVAELKSGDRSESHSHRKIYRPWGKYDSIDNGDRFQVKRITVNPGASLSLQKHHHRAEHWIVVSGTAEVTCDDDIRLLSENQSTYIPLGSVHRLRNHGKIPLEIIEVQSGSYLGEDDIVRLSDDYGRGGKTD